MCRATRLRDELVARIDDTGFRAHGLHVRVGDAVAEHRWAPDEREEIHSVAKAVAVLAAGIAADEGLAALDAPVGELLPAATDVTLRHLLSMSSGIDFPYSETMMTDWPDVAAEFLSRPTRGRVFQYSNASTYTAMHALSQRTGDVEEFLRPRLFTPLGLDDVAWRRCPLGRVLGGEGLSLRTEEMARLGKLIRDRGMWDGRRLVSAQTVDALHTAWIGTGARERAIAATRSRDGTAPVPRGGCMARTANCSSSSPTPSSRSPRTTTSAPTRSPHTSPSAAPPDPVETAPASRPILRRGRISCPASWRRDTRHSRPTADGQPSGDDRGGGIPSLATSTVDSGTGGVQKR